MNITCKTCGEPLPKWKPSNSLYCSLECRQTRIKENDRDRVEIFCKACGEPIPKWKPSNTLFCSSECNQIMKKKANYHAHYIAGISSGTTGAIHELLVCVELMRAGFYIFRSQSPNCPCDLIAMRDREIYRIEVTTGQHGITKNTHPAKKDSYLFDFLAVVYHDNVIDWFDRENLPVTFPLKQIQDAIVI